MVVGVSFFSGKKQSQITPSNSTSNNVPNTTPSSNDQNVIPQKVQLATPNNASSGVVGPTVPAGSNQLPDVVGTVVTSTDTMLTISSKGNTYSYSIANDTKLGVRPETPPFNDHQTTYSASNVKVGDHIEIISDNKSNKALVVYALTDTQYQRLSK